VEINSKTTPDTHTENLPFVLFQFSYFKLKLWNLTKYSKSLQDNAINEVKRKHLNIKFLDHGIFPGKG